MLAVVAKIVRPQYPRPDIHSFRGENRPPFGFANKTDAVSFGSYLFQGGRHVPFIMVYPPFESFWAIILQHNQVGQLCRLCWKTNFFFQRSYGLLPFSAQPRVALLWLVMLPCCNIQSSQCAPSPTGRGHLLFFTLHRLISLQAWLINGCWRILHRALRRR